MRIAKSLCLTIAIIFGLAAQSSAQWEKEVGKLAFPDAMLPRPAGPDKVAFFRTDSKIPGNPIELYVGDVKTGDEKRALPGYNFRECPTMTAAFSPDGTKLIVPQKDKGNWELFLYENGARTGKPITNLTQYRAEVTEDARSGLGITPDEQLSIDDLSWSPSGKRVMFNMVRLAKAAIWWHDLETGQSRQATEDRVGYNGTFFPNDTNFCYAAIRVTEGINSNEDILMRNIVTGEITPLCETKNQENDPSVSPDGKYVLYVMKTSGTNNVYVKNVASGETQQLTHASGTQQCALACWSSDGKQVFVQGSGFRARPAVFVQNFERF